jgi:Phosphodiester glycosidase
LAISCLTIACSKSNSTPAPAPPPPPPPPVVTPFLTLPPSWKYNATLSSAYPAGIQVYTFDSLQDGEKVKAYAVAFDSKAGTVELKPVMSTTAKKPSQFFTSETGSVLACINGGFFGSGQSFSTVRYGSITQSPNIRALNRVFNGSSTAYFPTRAALGIGANGAPSAAWIYHPAGNDDLMYRYPQPSPNVEGQAPQPTPDANFPAGGSIWNVHTAIGGAPMLIFNGNIQITDVAEMISINNNSARPRSAIGYNANGIVLLVAVEGDNPTAGYAGLSLPKLAQLLQSFSLTHAINLDGGGSTSLVLNNQLTVRPGDNGVERPVISAVLLKRK